MHFLAHVMKVDVRRLFQKFQRHRKGMGGKGGASTGWGGSFGESLSGEANGLEAMLGWPVCGMFKDPSGVL